MFGFSKITLIVAAVVIAALLAAIGVQSWRLKSEVKAHKATTELLVKEKVYSATLEVSVNRQNEEIELLAFEADARIAEAERLLGLVAPQVAKYRAEADRLRKAVGSGACTPAVTIIREGL